MKKHLIVSSLVFLSPLVQAAETRTVKTQDGLNLNITLQECYRQNEFFVVCNFNLRNPDQDHKTISVGLDNAQAMEGQQVLDAAAVAVGGGEYNTSTYSSLNVQLPAGVAQLVQVKFQPSDSSTALSQVRLFNAVFNATPLTSEPFTYPVLNPKGERLNALTRGNHQVGVVTCYRMPDKEVHCLVQDRNLGVEPIEVTSYRGAYHLITPDGLAIRPFNVAVGSLSKDFGDYNGRRVPSKTFVSTYVMFNLPSDVDYLPVLDVNGVPFRNIPIDASDTERLPSTQLGAALLDTRNDDIRGVISGCQWDQAQPEWVKCNSSFKSVDREKHELSASGGVGLTDDGLWAELSLGDAYQITEIPVEGVQNVTLWLKPNHKDISFFSYLEVGGLVFRNVVVK